MKTTILFILLAGIWITTGCENDVDPEVETHYFEADSGRQKAISKLFEIYSSSDKSKPYYEVVSKGYRFIVNYYPSGDLLTICHDTGSGWGGQLKNVTDAKLERLATLKVELDGINQYVISDTTVQHNRPIVEVKTNGRPN
ncbi:MAG: hypothetical protein ABIN80_00015 [Dyadobacter sp.]|uniref:hypothetical protein n=1 Tax=Dyadobacter sp. TaxID=1914288 RepID=UPI003262EFC9